MPIFPDKELPTIGFRGSKKIIFPPIKKWTIKFVNKYREEWTIDVEGTAKTAKLKATLYSKNLQRFYKDSVIYLYDREGYSPEFVKHRGKWAEF